MTRCLAFAAFLTATVACGPARQGAYPSYDAVVSQYVPAGSYQGEPLADGMPRPEGSSCDCPRIWYDGHWVYYYESHWLYWHYGYWYYYPYFYVYYWDGVPYLCQGPHYGIHKAGSGGGGPPPPPTLGSQSSGSPGTSDRTRSDFSPPAPSRSDSRSDPPSRSRDSDPGRRR
jgi:hypothetical protein